MKIAWGKLLKRLGWLFLALVFALSAYVMAISYRTLFPKPLSTQARLAQFPAESLPVDGTVRIYWNDYQVPFIEAETDQAAAFTLGMVHGHLRGSQLALLKRVSQGRLAEMGGAPLVPIDEALRTLDFGFAANEILANMPTETRNWLRHFVAGLNFQMRHSDTPPEFALFGFDREPYTMADIVTLSRLAGTDISWITLIGFMQSRLEADWDSIYRRTLETGARGKVSHVAEPTLGMLEAIFTDLSRSGSNAVVVGPSKSTTGAPLIANDPHLGQSLPNFWLLAGIKSPSYHVVGFMVPGLPFVGLGRNQDLAWGGTNMNAASSDIYDVSHLPDEAFAVREERIRVRYGRDKTIRIRRSPLGPVLSDVGVLPKRDGEVLALQWMGHRVSDEFTAFLRANRATTAVAFREAFTTYAVSGQTLLFAHVNGDIGLVPAVALPKRQYDVPPGFPLDAANPAHHWNGVADVMALPWVLNPPQDFLASANNRAFASDPPIGFYFSQSERIDRLHQQLQNVGTVDLAWLGDLQQDVVSLSAKRLADQLALRIRELQSDNSHELVAEQLTIWDGNYAADAAAPVMFETLLYRLVRAFQAQTGRKGGYYSDWNYLVAHFLADFDALSLSERQSLMTKALEEAALDRVSYPVWGDMHRLQARSLLASVPLIGGRFVYSDQPASGSRETVYKTAHGLVNERHNSSYGAQSRYLASMDDLDANYFVLFGGQDGWLGSVNFDDQVQLFRDGETIQMPLRMSTVRETFATTMVWAVGESQVLQQR